MKNNKRTSKISFSSINTPAPISTDTLNACVPFGVIPEPSTSHSSHTILPSDEAIGSIGDSNVVLVRGASGSGKSSTLRGIQQRLSPHSRVHIVQEQHEQIALIDQLAGPLQSRLSTLSHAGLSEPKLWALPPSCLSVGQLARFSLAIQMHNAQPGDLIIADEFATPLDRVSAYALCQTMRRWAKRNQITLIAASAHEDLESMLNPDLVLDLDNQDVRSSEHVPRQTITIEQGTNDDYKQLAHFHYRAGKPATCVHILRAVRHTFSTLTSSSDDQRVLAGVLIISMPTLNGSWRNRAWPNFFRTGDKRTDAHRINTHLRCISRVIVEPRSRGLGIATQLVRSYLKNPITQATEAFAAMGSICPFFEHAGMTPMVMFHAPDDLRLLDALCGQSIELQSLITCPMLLDPHLHHELIRWGKSKKIINTNDLSQPELDRELLAHLARSAACRLMNQPRAYTHVHNDDEPRDRHGNRAG